MVPFLSLVSLEQAMEVSQPHPPVAAVTACVSVMGRRAGLPPEVVIPLAASLQSVSLKVSKSCASNHFLRRFGSRNTRYADLTGEL